MTKSTAKVNEVNEDVCITDDDVKEKIEYWSHALVCYVLCVKTPYRIVNAFIRRIWGKFGINKVIMSVNGVFIVSF